VLSDPASLDRLLLPSPQLNANAARRINITFFISLCFGFTFLFAVQLPAVPDPLQVADKE